MTKNTASPKFVILHRRWRGGSGYKSVTVGTLQELTKANLCRLQSCNAVNHGNMNAFVWFKYIGQICLV